MIKLTITNADGSASEGMEGKNPLVAKAKLVAALKAFADRPEEEIPFEEVEKALAPFLSNFSDKEIYEKTSGYVQILDEILKQSKAAS